jgi:hypothetical protein
MRTKLTERAGWQIIEVYCDEISGTKGRERRPAFDRVLKAAVCMPATGSASPRRRTCSDAAPVTRSVVDVIFDRRRESARICV